MDNAAKVAHVAPERLRAYIRQSGVVEKQRGRWRVVEDNRPRQIWFFSNDEIVYPTLPGYESAAKVGRYRSAVGQFLASNDQKDLAPFVADGVRDTRGEFYPFETRPNMLYRLNAIHGETYEQVYRIVV
jgi:hypothetical protein